MVNCKFKRANVLVKILDLRVGAIEFELATLTNTIYKDFETKISIFLRT